MIRTFRYKKSLSLLFVLTYLLIGSGIGNAMVWCQESESFSHLEYNLAGKCQHVCLPAEGSHETLGQAAIPPVLQPFTDDCHDTRVFLSHAPSPGGKNLPPAPVSLGGFSTHLPPGSRLAPAGLTNLNQPPPPQALIALRTIVLLN